MREIKFRVWNKNRNMFIIDGMTPKEIQDDATQSMELPIMTNEDCVWQQYTGLKDKNGVEIYEGDYVHRVDGYTGTVEYGRVLHSNTGKAYVGFYLRKDKDNYTHIDGTLKVLGNIFEGVDK